MAWRWPRREKSSVRCQPAWPDASLPGPTDHRPAPHATSSHRPAQASGLTSQLCSLTSQDSRGELSPEGIKSGLFGTKPHT